MTGSRTARKRNGLHGGCGLPSWVFLFALISFPFLSCCATSGIGGAGRQVRLPVCSPILDTFLLTEVSRVDPLSRRYRMETPFGDHLFLRVYAGLGEASAETVIREQRTALEAVFENALAPYPGEVTREIVCNDAFLPVYHDMVLNGVRYRYYTLYSTDRFGIGVCSPDLIGYRTLTGWIQCLKSGELIVVDYHTDRNRPVAELQRFLTGFTCRECFKRAAPDDHRAER